jgi:hypothetical protein
LYLLIASAFSAFTLSNSKDDIVGLWGFDLKEKATGGCTRGVYREDEENFGGIGLLVEEDFYREGK